MILKGSQRGGAQALALHLLNEADNDHIEVHSVNGFMAGDVEGALQEIQAINRATNCKQYMFSLSLSPPQGAVVSDQDFLDAIQQGMEKLGLADQPHVVIFHEKNARRHCHVVISRIDTDVMKSINLPFFKERLCELSHQLYLIHGWEVPKGHEDRALTDPLNYSLEEYQVAKRAKRDPKVIKACLQDCWAQSDSKISFTAALQTNGFMLCRGDRRGFVAIDVDGNIYSLSRWLGVKTKELKSRLGDPEGLLSIEASLAPFEAHTADTTASDSNHTLAEFDAKMAGLLRRKEHLKCQQRSERFKLRDTHQDQKLARIKELRHAQSGLQGLWNWASGKRAHLIAVHKAELDILEEKAQIEALDLSKRQRDERRLLQIKISQLQSWRDAQFGLSASKPVNVHQPDLVQPNPEELKRAERVRQNPEYILDVIADKEAHFTRNDIQRALSKYIIDPQAYQAAIAAVLESDKLVIVEDSKSPIYSTREMVDLETRMVELAKGMASHKAYGVSSGNLKSAIQRQNKALQKEVGANLSEEQRRAITHLVNRRQLSAVIGLAGAGKSTSRSVR